jgi:hypothetical protein
MSFIKSVLAGLAALLLAILALIGAAVVSMFAFHRWWFETHGIGAVSIGIGQLALTIAVAIAVLAFAAGFWWEFRRASN